MYPVDASNIVYSFICIINDLMDYKLLLTQDEIYFPYTVIGEIFSVYNYSHDITLVS